jgi:hypothetical protein
MSSFDRPPQTAFIFKNVAGTNLDRVNFHVGIT